MTDNEAYVRIGEFIESHPSETYSELAARLGLTSAMVARIARLRGIRRRPGKRASLEAAVAVIDAATPQPSQAPTGEAAAPPTEGPISAAPDALLAGESLSAKPGAPSVETAAM